MHLNVNADTLKEVHLICMRTLFSVCVDVSV